MATLWQDLKYAARSLRLNPAYTAIVIATLTLGIGANAAIFSVADAVMLRPYPYPDIDRIVDDQRNDARRAATMSVAWPTFQDWQAQHQSFEYLGIFRNAIVNLTGGDQPERLQRRRSPRRPCSARWASGPLAGRMFGAAEEQPGAPRVGRHQRAALAQPVRRGSRADRPGDRAEQRAARRRRHHAAGDALSVAADRRLAAARARSSRRCRPVARQSSRPVRRRAS